MNLLVFPGICLYFLIGSFFGKVTKSDDNGDELASVVWFMFWPIVIVTIIVMLIIMLFSKFILELYRYFNTF